VLIPVDLVVTTIPKGLMKILPEPTEQWQPSQE